MVSTWVHIAGLTQVFKDASMVQREAERERETGANGDTHHQWDYHIHHHNGNERLSYQLLSGLPQVGRVDTLGHGPYHNDIRVLHYFLWLRCLASLIVPLNGVWCEGKDALCPRIPWILWIRNHHYLLACNPIRCYSLQLGDRRPNSRFNKLDAISSHMGLVGASISRSAQVKYRSKASGRLADNLNQCFSETPSARGAASIA
jgi:hypothetical protein